MWEINETEITSWLALTSQQFNILKAIKGLELRGEQTTPKNISQEYDRFYGGIHYANLLSQIKLLIERRLIVKTGRANYSVNLRGIENTVSEQKNNLRNKLEDIEAFGESAEDYLSRISTREELPTARYLDHRAFYKKLVELTNKSKIMSTNILWPAIGHTYTVYSMTGRTEYVEAMRRRCFEEKTLVYRYITPLDIDYPYALAMNIHHDHELAYKECMKTIETLETQVNMYETLEIYYLDRPFELDMIIPVIGDKPREVLMVIRAPLMSGVYIRSKEIAEDFQRLFEKTTKECKKVEGNFATRLFKTLRKKAREKYKPKK